MKKNILVTVMEALHGIENQGVRTRHGVYNKLDSLIRNCIESREIPLQVNNVTYEEYLKNAPNTIGFSSLDESIRAEVLPHQGPFSYLENNRILWIVRLAVTLSIINDYPLSSETVNTLLEKSTNSQPDEVRGSSFIKSMGNVDRNAAVLHYVIRDVYTALNIDMESYSCDKLATDMNGGGSIMACAIANNVGSSSMVIFGDTLRRKEDVMKICASVKRDYEFLIVLIDELMNNESLLRYMNNSTMYTRLNTQEDVDAAVSELGDEIGNLMFTPIIYNRTPQNIVYDSDGDDPSDLSFEDGVDEIEYNMSYAGLCLNLRLRNLGIYDKNDTEVSRCILRCVSTDFVTMVVDIDSVLNFKHPILGRYLDSTVAFIQNVGICDSINRVGNFEKIVAETGITNEYFLLLLKINANGVSDSAVRMLKIMNKLGILDIVYRRALLSYKYRNAESQNYGEVEESLDSVYHCFSANGKEGLSSDDILTIDKLGINIEIVDAINTAFPTPVSVGFGRYVQDKTASRLLFNGMTCKIEDMSEEKYAEFENALIGSTNIDKAIALVKRISRTYISMNTLIYAICDYINHFDRDIDWLSDKFFSNKAIELDKALSFTGSMGNSRRHITVFHTFGTLNNYKKFTLFAALGTERYLEFLSKYSRTTVHNALDIFEQTHVDNRGLSIIDSLSSIMKTFEHMYDLGCHIDDFAAVYFITTLKENNEERLKFLRDIRCMGDRNVISKMCTDERTRNKAEMLFKKIGCTVEDLLPKRMNLTDMVGDVYTVHFHKHDDMDVVNLGEITNCCQRFGGAAESCIIEGLLNPYSGFISVRQNNTGKIIAQSWVWLTDDKKTLVLDSIETKFMSVIDKITKVICEWGEEQPYNIHIGAAYTKIHTGVSQDYGYKLVDMTKDDYRLGHSGQLEELEKYIDENVDADILKISEAYKVFILKDSSSFGINNISAWGDLSMQSLLSSRHSVCKTIPNPKMNATRVVGDNIYTDASMNRYIRVKTK